MMGHEGIVRVITAVADEFARRAKRYSSVSRVRVFRRSSAVMSAAGQGPPSTTGPYHGDSSGGSGGGGGGGGGSGSSSGSGGGSGSGSGGGSGVGGGAAQGVPLSAPEQRVPTRAPCPVPPLSSSMGVAGTLAGASSGPLGSASAPSSSRAHVESAGSDLEGSARSTQGDPGPGPLTQRRPYSGVPTRRPQSARVRGVGAPPPPLFRSGLGRCGFVDAACLLSDHC
jgi:hypothetical protein